MKKRGVSPVIATVLLVGIVIVLSTVVFFWFRSFIHESNLKFGKDVSLSCPHVKFSAQYSDGEIQISNTGDVPIYSFNVQINQVGGAYSTKDISVLVSNAVGGKSTWPQFGLIQGSAFSQNIQSQVSNAKSLVLVPILRGALKNGQQQSYTCEGKYGQTVSV